MSLSLNATWNQRAELARHPCGRRQWPAPVASIRLMEVKEHPGRCAYDGGFAIRAMSFFCPHFRPDDEACLRLHTDCVPGRRGCVLPRTTVYAVPAEQRVREREEENRRRAIEKLWGQPPAETEKPDDGAGSP